MDVREKLIDLIIDAKRADSEEGSFTEYLADHLISNGVTVQEWISVDDRLPEADGAYLVTIEYSGNRQGIDIRYFAVDGDKIDEYELAGQKRVWFLYDSEYGYVSTNSVTHWMPLPEPPKGE